jgi:hypothetical protein
MSKKLYAALLPVLAVVALGVAAVGQASAATITSGTAKPFLAIYGYPPETAENAAKEKAIGGGLGRNFGFGEDMVFQAGNGQGTALAIVLEAGGKEIAKSEAKETILTGTLMSNKTGENNPLSFTIDDVDFQDNILTVEGKATKVPSFADTFDNEWIAEICSPAAVEAKCKTDAQFTQGNKPGGVEISNVAFNIGAPSSPTVVQGTAWGKWENGAAKKAPCISLETPAAGNPTLVETQGAAVGAVAKTVSGKACLISANNDWYSIGEEKEEPAITIANE